MRGISFDLNRVVPLAQKRLICVMLSSTLYSLSSVTLAATEPTALLQNSQQQSLSLAEAIQQAQTHNPLHPSWQRQQEQYRLALQLSGRPANPELDLQIDTLRQASREQSISLRQTLDWHGTRALQRTIAATELQANDNQHHLYQAQLSVWVMAAYAQWVLAQQQVLLNQHASQLQQQLLLAAEQRLQAGRIAQIERDQVQLSGWKASQALDTARYAVQRAAQQLQRFWPNTALAERTLSPRERLPSIDPAFFTNAQQLLSQHAKLQLNQATEQLQLIQKQAKPSPSVLLGWRSSAAEQQTEQQISIGLSMPLPIFQRNQTALSAAKTQYQLQTNALQLLQQQRQQQQQQWQLDEQRQRQQLAQIEQQQLPHAQQLQQKMLIGFREGKFDRVAVQQAQQEVLQWAQAAHEQQAQAWQSQLKRAADAVGLDSDVDFIDPNSLQRQQQAWFERSLNALSPALTLLP